MKVAIFGEDSIVGMLVLGGEMVRMALGKKLMNLVEVETDRETDKVIQMDE